MEQPHAPQPQADRAEQFIPEWEVPPPTSEEDAARSYRQLQAFFLYGDPLEQDGAARVLPLRLAAQHHSGDAPVLACNGQTAFQLLHHQYQERRQAQIAFLSRLRRVRTGLQELLSLQEEGSSATIGQLDFAEDLIAFDKIKQLAVDPASSHLSASRLERVRAALHTLTAAQESLTARPLTLFTSETILQSYALAAIFDQADIRVASGQSCAQAGIHSQKAIAQWVQLIKALRMGELLIEQHYDEQLHDPYFDHFDLTYLNPEDLQSLPLTLVIEESPKILCQANDFLHLLTADGFVKVLGLNYLEDLFQLEDQQDTNYLELASLAICRRNSYIFQGGIEAPTLLDQAYQKGLALPGPAFWNILIPGPELEADGHVCYQLLAAAESRYFPRLEYETSDNHFENRQLHLQDNPTPDAERVHYEQAIRQGGELTSWSFAFTIADFLAMHRQGREQIAIIPPNIQHPKLVSVADYLSASGEATAGLIPYIWLVDEDDQLQRAAVPLSWMQQCRQRLEYWDFLQSLAGTNPTQRQATAEELQAEWEDRQNAEIAHLKATLEEQFARERSSDLQTAVYRMLNGLLSQENDLENVLLEMSQAEPPPVVEAPLQPAAPAAEPKAEPAAAEPKAEPPPEDPPPISSEAWVESDECTSCRDCIDALPSVFKYDDNKQAYVHNPRGGTFAKIVKAAEKCPAACIHPGVPWNKDEADLEQWVKRAEKFN